MNGGDCFDLGGVHIDIFGCKGHTQGSLCMLIREDRALLLGDACNGLTFLFDEFSTGVREYRDSLVELKAQTDGKYDSILLSHTGGNPSLDMIASNITVCGDILSGKTDDQPFEFKGMELKLAKAFSFAKGRLDGGSGNIVYSDDTKNR
jgi:glyoxylase-like metal-dependent hydrolase (beta-lactamase superfamily II)